MLTNTIPVITEIIIWGNNWFTNTNAHLLHIQALLIWSYCQNASASAFCDRHHLCFIHLYNEETQNIFMNISEAQYSFASSLFVGASKSAAAQTFQSRSVNLTIIVGIKSLHSLICIGGTEELWNHEELRSCQCYRKISPSCFQAYNPEEGWNPQF